MIEPILTAPGNIFEEDAPEEKQPWHKRLLFGLFQMLIYVAAFMVFRAISKKQAETTKVKCKLKYFSPTITEHWYGKTVTWTERAKPLTDEEMREM